MAVDLYNQIKLWQCGLERILAEYERQGRDAATEKLFIFTTELNTTVENLKRSKEDTQADKELRKLIETNNAYLREQERIIK